MKLLDAQSGKVMDRRHFHRDASDDVTLARQLVKAVLGKTATWPEDDEVDGLMQSQGGFLDFGCSSWPQDVEGDPHDTGEYGEVEDSDTEELSRCEVAGSFFGVPVPNGSAVPVMDVASSTSEPIPITQGTCDVAPSVRQEAEPLRTEAASGRAEIPRGPSAKTLPPSAKRGKRQPLTSQQQAWICKQRNEFWGFSSTEAPPAFRNQKYLG